PGAANRADRAEAGDRLRRAGPANGQHEMAGGQAAGRGALDRLERGAGDGQDGHVAARIAAYESGGVLSSVGGRDGELGFAFKDVRGGQDLVVAPGDAAG